MATQLATRTDSLPAELSERLQAWATEANAALSDSTRRAYAVDSRAFADWCARKGLPTLPAQRDGRASFSASPRSRHPRTRARTGSPELESRKHEPETEVQNGIAPVVGTRPARFDVVGRSLAPTPSLTSKLRAALPAPRRRTSRKEILRVFIAARQVPPPPISTGRSDAIAQRY